MAAAAEQKRARGEKLTAREVAALRKGERRRDEELRWQHYGSIPQKHWREMSGRQAKVINDQATRYGIPFAGRTIELPAVVRALHDFLADNAHRLAAVDGEDDEEPWLDKLREEKYLIAKMERHALEGRLLPREKVHTHFARVAQVLRNAGEVLQRKFGNDAHAILDEALDECIRVVSSLADDDRDEPLSDD